MVTTEQVVERKGVIRSGMEGRGLLVIAFNLRHWLRKILSFGHL
jgi:hypothetical protein